MNLKWDDPLPEDAEERRAFDDTINKCGPGYSGLRQVSAILRVWSLATTRSGKTANLLAVLSNECARADDELQRLNRIVNLVVEHDSNLIDHLDREAERDWK